MSITGLGGEHVGGQAHATLTRRLLLTSTTLPVCWLLSGRDLERLENPVYSVQGHGSIINAIDGVGGQDVGYGAPELVTGSRDGMFSMWIC